MPDRDSLGTRMKTYYEEVPKFRLYRRTPVAIRIDGKAFHTFTRGFKKPFDEILIKSMQQTMQYLCENIQGCVLGYTQSDEITLILQDYKTLTTDAWFDYEIQKICSISASMATMAFNRYFSTNVQEYISIMEDSWKTEEDDNYLNTLMLAIEKGAMFDARCFNIPKEEVTNLVFWRQLDAARNSVQMVGQAYFSHKELQNKSCSDIQDMLMEKYNINWNDFPTTQKRGSCCIKHDWTTTCAKTNENGEVETWVAERPHWFIDNEIPQFKGEGRQYIEKLINFEEE
jgi:tRNA(His) 5'-end guanylyltransferase